MTLEDACYALDLGETFGAVFPLVHADDRDKLKAYFCTSVHVSDRRVRQPAPEATGDICGRCGGMLVITGTCKTCQLCGESSGGCG